ncbi:hypothetical protein CLOSTMETH_02073 [[Clostridium] methylpentosum DSM 5476]|uniref:Uncharacterized protein n=1 Tax=[Clostridium] methylpentosum DSM 5476 TaxID=537013 RepID=C0EDZ4_9FIRM|nr:hypothetical protein CLOSTMETH_02073 [[Clostridium] methylpentosum DSM 5476]
MKRILSESEIAVQRILPRNSGEESKTDTKHLEEKLDKIFKQLVYK